MTTNSLQRNKRELTKRNFTLRDQVQNGWLQQHLNLFLAVMVLNEPSRPNRKRLKRLTLSLKVLALNHVRYALRTLQALYGRGFK